MQGRILVQLLYLAGLQGVSRPQTPHSGRAISILCWRVACPVASKWQVGEGIVSGLQHHSGPTQILDTWSILDIRCTGIA